jgi:3-oxoacid CoA-transferase
MDLVAGKQQLIIMMEHRDSQGRAKLVRKSAFPLTGVDCVDVVVTDLAVLRRINGDFVVEQIADGFTFEEIQALTELEIKEKSDIRTQKSDAVTNGRPTVASVRTTTS